MKTRLSTVTSIALTVVLAAAAALAGCKVAEHIAQQAGYGEQFKFAQSAYGAIAPMSEAYEVEVGRTMGAQVIPMGESLCKDEGLTRYVNLVGQTVVRQQQRHKLARHQFAVLNSDQVNAYSCPGGYFFITKGALRVMDNEAQLAGLLAHEVAHVDREHILGDIKKANVASAFSQGQKLWGDRNRGEFSRIMNALSQFGTNRLFKTGHSRAQEFEADELGMKYAAAAGYDPDGLRQFLAKVAAQQGTQKQRFAVLDRTHPPLQERIRRLQNEMSSKNLKPGVGATLQRRFQSNVRS